MRLRKNRPALEPGVRVANQRSPMHAAACDIAVSEMTGVAPGDMCGWILITIDHTTPGKHRSMVMQGCHGGSDDEWAAMWLERTAIDIRESS